ncbi:hypothetical protein RB213_008699 [Colletotrichum asianum]
MSPGRSSSALCTYRTVPTNQERFPQPTCLLFGTLGSPWPEENGTTAIPKAMRGTRIGLQSVDDPMGGPGSRLLQSDYLQLE